MTDKNSTREWIATLLTQFAGQANTLTINRAYITLTGGLESALLLSQIIYWTDRATMDDGWFAKSYSEWEDELTLSEYQVRKATKTLIPFGIETKLKHFNGVPTLHYRLNKIEFSEWILKKLQNGNLKNSSMDSEEISEPLTEPTAEPTAEKKISSRKRDAFYDAISECFGITSGGWIGNVKSMMLGTAKKGQWGQCNFEPPVTDAAEILAFKPYMQQRMAEKNCKEITACATIQRWFYDFRAAAQPKAAPAVAFDLSKWTSNNSLSFLEGENT